MYIGKHRVESGKPRQKKALLLLASVALLICVVVGGSVAFLSTSTGPLKNTFNPSHVTCRVTEKFENNEKKDVSVTNTGDTEAYIRAAIVVTGKDAEGGNVYAGQPKAGTDYTIDLNRTDWTQIGDYYYYKFPVAAGESTSNLIKTCTPVNGNTPEGYDLNVEILASAIQSKPASVVQQTWGVTISNDSVTAYTGQ